MRKLTYIIFLFAITIIGCSSCSKDDNDSNSEINLPISGTYVWKFSFKMPTDPPEIANQTSSMNFSNSNITYKMEGNAYQNTYNMSILSYDKKEKKIITVGKGGVSISKEGKYFVLFLKDIKENKVTIFKKEFEKKEDAEKFNKPADDSTDSHGWNIYTRQ